MVAGYLLADSEPTARRHFWDEFYVETLGWVPVDPSLGDDGTRAPSPLGENVDARAYYFGNLDNRHVTLTKGLNTVNQMFPAGVTRMDRDMPYLLSFQEEAVGSGFSYTTTFGDLTVTGTY